MTGLVGDQFMTKSLAPALMAAFLASATVPAAAVEGTLDGVVYSLPEETGFSTVGVVFVEPDKLQETVDEHRRAVPAEDPLIVFMSIPRTAAAADRALNVVLMRDPAVPSEGMLVVQKLREGAVYEDGVAKLDVTKFKSPAPGQRSYAIQTGLGFAPDVIASCAQDRFDKRESCSVTLPRPNGHRLAWPGVRLTEFDPRVMRHEIRDLIEKTLPVEAAKARDGEEITARAPGTQQVAALEGTLDGVTYAAPAGSLFLDRELRLLKSADLQAGVDAVRKDAAEDREITLFSTRPVSRAGRAEETILSATRLADPDERDVDVRHQACEGIKPHPDVACLDMTAVKDEEAKPGLRGYGVKTGLAFAEKASVLCIDSVGGRECEIQVLRPERILLEWKMVSLDDADAPAMRDRVRKLISDALPLEAAKAK